MFYSCTSGNVNKTDPGTFCGDCDCQSPIFKQALGTLQLLQVSLSAKMRCFYADTLDILELLNNSFVSTCSKIYRYISASVGHP